MPLSIRSPAVSSQADARSDADRRRRRSRSDRGAVTGDHALDRGLALEALDGCLRQELDAVVAVKVEVDPRRARPEDSFEGERGHVEHRHLAALLSGRSCDLGADPARADHDQPLAGFDSLADPLESARVRR